MMPLWMAIALVGLLVSAVLAVVVGTGWASLRFRVHGDYFYGQQDFGNAWFLAFLCGLAMTGASIVIAWRMGVDVGMVIGG